MRLLLTLVWVTLTTASTIRYTPTKVLLAKLQSAAALEKKDQEQAPANTQYHEQDSDGFYSYGYSAGRSAKAEYLTLDGSSHGFYSYVDADGQLQTVKYEAGGTQGFKAAATNLPKAPKNPNRVPVRDTPEVQEAKKAHFEAYREAELREAELREAYASQNEAARYEDAIAEAQQQQQQQEQQQEQQKSERPQQEVADILENTRSKILAILSESGNGAGGVGGSSSSASAEQNINNNFNGGSREEINIEFTQDQEGGGENSANDDGENSGLLSIDSLQITHDTSGREANEEDNTSDGSGGRGGGEVSDNITLENAEEEENEARQSGGSSVGASHELTSSGERQVTTYKLSDLLNSDDHLNTHTLYTFESENEGEESSKDLLRLSELQEKSDLRFAQQNSRSSGSSSEKVRVPIHSYYTVRAPRTKYTVVTPTTHQLVPREEALKRGHSLPISISSSYLSHRLRSK